MSDWVNARLSDIAEIVMGQSPLGETTNTLGKGKPLLNGPTEFGIKNPLAVQYTTDSRKNSKIDDLLFCVRGSTTGKMNWSDKEYSIGRGLASIRHKKGKEYRYFLKGVIDFNLDLILSSATGSTFPNVSKDQLNDLEIQVPPLPEQQAIASVLSSLDDKIDLLHRQNKTLEAMAETLFRQWFIEEANEDWEEISLCDLIEIRGGFSYKGEFIGYGDSILLGMGCVSFNNRFLINGARKYGGICPEKFIAKVGDIVIATRQQSDHFPILGFPAMIPQELNNKIIIVGTNLYFVKNKSNVSNHLIFQILKSKEYQNHIKSSSKGSTVRMITKDAIENFSFLMPISENLALIDNNISNIATKINKNTFYIKTLENLRDTLLPKLMSGEIRVQH